ncbi:MAG: class I SAM-dependent methyltransferase [Nitrospirota bacterium]
MRSIALAEAILRYFGATTTLREWVTSPLARNLRLLEINEAGALSSVLQSAPGHRLVQYPDYDMMALDLDSGSFDAVVHSDTVEHVADSLQGLKECHRVLKPGGMFLHCSDHSRTAHKAQPGASTEFSR